MNGPFTGLLVPMLTPFRDDLSIDSAKCVEYCHNLLSQGADGIVLCGTTGEANSMSAGERRVLLEAIRAGGVAAEHLMVGIGDCSISETAQAMRHCAAQGVSSVLLLPPFFYKRPVVSDDGLFNFVAEVIRQSDVKMRIYLYHIPQVTQIGWSIDLIRRLINAFGHQITGVKDSSGDPDNTKTLIESFPELDIFPGSELNLLPSLLAGGVGCITATGNINLHGIRSIFSAVNSSGVELLQERANAVRLAVQEIGPPLTVMKSYLALKSGDPGWANVRPPLSIVPKDRVELLDRNLQAIGYEHSFA